MITKFCVLESFSQLTIAEIDLIIALEVEA
jgi:hypothetical protein